MVQIIRFVSNNFDKNGQFPSYINNFCHIDHLLFIVFQLHRGKHPLSMNRYNKFIKIRSIIHRFQFETIYPQEFGLVPKNII